MQSKTSLVGLSGNQETGQHAKQPAILATSMAGWQSQPSCWHRERSCCLGELQMQWLLPKVSSGGQTQPFCLQHRFPKWAQPTAQHSRILRLRDPWESRTLPLNSQQSCAVRTVLCNRPCFTYSPDEVLSAASSCQTAAELINCFCQDS